MDLYAAGVIEKVDISVTLNGKTITEKIIVDRHNIRSAKEKFAKKQKENKIKDTNDGL